MRLASRWPVQRANAIHWAAWQRRTEPVFRAHDGGTWAEPRDSRIARRTGRSSRWWRRVRQPAEAQVPETASGSILLRAQRVHGVNARGASGGDPGGGESDQQEERGAAAEHHGIRGAGAIEKARDEPGGGQRA